MASNRFRREPLALEPPFIASQVRSISSGKTQGFGHQADLININHNKGPLANWLLTLFTSSVRGALKARLQNIFF